MEVGQAQLVQVIAAVGGGQEIGRQGVSKRKPPVDSPSPKRAFIRSLALWETFCTLGEKRVCNTSVKLSTLSG